MDERPAAEGLLGRQRRAIVRAGGIGLLGLAVLAAMGVATARLAGAPGLGALEWSPEWVVLAVIIGLLGTGCQGPRLVALLPPGCPRPPAVPVGTMVLGATVLNLSFPGPAGELALALAMERRWGVPASAALAAAVHARFLGLLVGAASVLGLLLWVPMDPRFVLPLRLGALVVGAGGAVLGALSFRPALLEGLSRATVGRLAQALGGGGAGRALAGLDATVARFAGYLRASATQGVGAWLVATGWSALSIALLSAATAVAARAFGVVVDPVGVFFTINLAQTAAIALVVLPGGLGSFDLAVTVGLVGSAGVTAPEAGVVVIAVRACQLITMGVATLAVVGWGRALLDARLLDGPGGPVLR